MKFKSGHEITPMDEAERKKRCEYWEGMPQSAERYNPGRWILLKDFNRIADKIYTLKFKRTDVVVMTWPKCGTTLTQEIIWTMTHNPGLNHPKADSFIWSRSPYLEFDMFVPPLEGPLPKNNPIFETFEQLCPGRDPNNGVTLQTIEALPEPRVVKTHLPFSLMPPSVLDTSKVVYVARNPKDVVVSIYHHLHNTNEEGYRGTFEDFVQCFVEDNSLYGPYWLHLKEAWEKRNHPNLHFIFFEDWKANPMEVLKKLNVFLDTKLTEDQLEKIAKYTSFSEMKARFLKLNFEDNVLSFFSREGGFFRKGEAGDWKCRLTPALEAKLDEWIKKNMDFGVDFKYGV